MRDLRGGRVAPGLNRCSACPTVDGFTGLAVPLPLREVSLPSAEGISYLAVGEVESLPST